MAEASDDEDDAHVPEASAPPERELIDLPPAPTSAPPMFNKERCIALRVVYGAGLRRAHQKIATCIISQRLSVVFLVSFRRRKRKREKTSNANL